MSPPALPPPDPRIRVVATFAELAATPLVAPCQAICWRRTPSGDYDEVGRALVDAALVAARGITVLDEPLLDALPLSPAGRTAVATLRADLAALRALGADPVLECVRGAPRDDDPILPTDVYSWHVDRADLPAATWLCSYTAPASEGLFPGDATRAIDDPPLRARLRAQFGAGDDAAFTAFLAEHSYDLHYRPRPGARPFSFGVGNLWKLALQHPGATVPPLVHRAAEDLPGLPPRLLLIA